MLDLRFFKKLEIVKIGDILDNVGFFSVENKYRDVQISGVSTLKDASEGDLSFFSNTKYMNDLSATKASAVVITKSMFNSVPAGCVPLVADHVIIAYAKILDYLYPTEKFEAKIGNLVKIGNLTKLPDACFIGDFVSIGENVKIGNKVTIGSNVAIRDGVVIGDNCTIGDNVTLSHCIIGNNVVINSGARIGESGFGIIPFADEVCYVRQIGRVLINDNVRIGANTTIDRGSLEDTEIGRNTIIDNLVQIGHNVKIGESVVIVSQVGIAGSTKIGNRAVLAGQVGVAGHLVIGNNVTIAAKSGVAQNIPDGAVYAGIPAKDVLTWRKEVAILKNMVKMRGKS